MKTILIILLLAIPATAADTNLWAPGTQFNPYVIQQTGPGQAQVTTKFPNLNQPIMAPGQPYNPYVVQDQGNGTTTMGTEYPDLGGSGSED